jgi:2-dehydropantoate 2-reductase
MGKNAVRDKKVLIVGTGALGTLFAARLSAVGAQVTMLGTWDAGLAALNADGAHIEGVGCFPVLATADPTECRDAKSVLVLVKSWQTARIASQLAECLAPDGLVLTLQNGLGNDAVLASALGAHRVSQGITTLGATLTEPGHVRMAGEAPIWLQAFLQDGLLVEMLREAGFPVEIVDDIRARVWGKLVVNAAINPLTALLRVKNGVLLESASTLDLLGDLACEAAAVAFAHGVTLPFPDPKRAVEEVACSTSENLSSMLRDVLRGAPTEVDAINGAIVRTGDEKEVPVPCNRVVWSLLKDYPFVVR